MIPRVEQLESRCLLATYEAWPGQPLAPLVQQLQAGDSLLLHAGTYDEGLAGPFPEGASWEAPTRIGAYGDGPVILRPDLAVDPYARGLFVWQGRYVEFFELVIDGGYDGVKITWASSNPEGADHIRLQDLEIKNALNQGILVTQGPNSPDTGDWCEFIRLYVHDNGTDYGLDHGGYFGADHALIVGGWWARNRGAGIQIYNTGPNGGPEQPYQTVVNWPRIWGNAWVQFADWGRDTINVGAVPYHSVGYGGKPPRWVDFWRHENWRGPELSDVGKTPRPVARPVRTW